MSETGTTTRWLDHPDGHRLACLTAPGTGAGVVFLGGYASDMTGAKASFLDRWCRDRGRPCLRFDYRGHGRSGGAFGEGTIGRWTDDALTAFDALTEGRQILVGSSMGGWIMLNLALRRPERVAGLIGVAAAPDFSQDVWWTMTAEQRAATPRDGAVSLEDDDGATAFSRAFLEDGRANLLLRAPLEIDAPVRLLQGMRDRAVPWDTALRIARCLTTDDVVVDLVKDGDHRLSRAEDLARLGRTLDELLEVRREAARSAAIPDR